MRIEGWQTLLYDHLDAARTSTFVWGENDCALWCAEWVRKVTGKDYTTDWKGQYITEQGLQALMMERGYATPSDIADEHLPRIDLPFTRRGDIVLHPHGCLGICDGIISYFLTLDGFTRLHTRKCSAAWKVD